jgi:hypothetical protein
MSGVDQQALRAAAEAYAEARREYAAAKAAAEAAYACLQASPETIEYQIDWNVARRDEAAAAWHVKQAEESYRSAGGYVADEHE